MDIGEIVYTAIMIAERLRSSIVNHSRLYYNVVVPKLTVIAVILIETLISITFSLRGQILVFLRLQNQILAGLSKSESFLLQKQLI